MLKHIAHRLLQHFGFDIVRYTKENFYALKRQSVLQRCNINLVLDVGASEGNYALALRSLDYSGRIISFEPLSESFSTLEKRSEKDSLWNSENLAAGDCDGESEINVAGRITSSSLLPILQRHINVCNESAYIRKEKIRVARLDTVLGHTIKPSDRLFLKADVQGYEKRVLLGAEKIMGNTWAVELELSFVPLYDSAPLAYEILSYLKDKHFTPASFRPVLTDPATEQLLQVDCLFVREP